MTNATQDSIAERLEAEHDWAALAAHLQGQLDADEPAYYAIAMKLAKVLEVHLAEHERAGNTLEWLLTKSPADERARCELERIRSESEDWPGLVKAYRLGMLSAESTEETLSLLQRIVRVHNDAQGDVAKGRAAAIEMLTLQPDSAWAWEHLEQSHASDESWWELVKGLTQAAMSTKAEAGTITLHIATVMDECLGQHERAITLYEAALDSGADALIALEGLEALYAEGEVWDKLAHTYERLLPLALDREERVTIRRNWAMVLSDGLNDIPGALALYDQILEDAPEDKEAFQAMMALQKRSS